MKSVVFFDLDETLVAQEQAFDRAYRAAARRASELASIDQAGFAASLPQVAQEVAERTPFAELLGQCRFGGRDVLWCAAIGDTTLEREIARFAGSYRADVWQAALLRQGIADERIAEDVGVAFCGAMAEGLTLFPEVEAVLCRLGASARLAVITNGMTAPQREKLSRLGIESHFERLFASAAVGAGKPSSVIFEHALEEMAVSPSAAVMAGDSLEGDIAGAQSVGLRTIWINRLRLPRGGAVIPDAELPDLSSIEACLAAGFNV